MRVSAIRLYNESVGRSDSSTTRVSVDQTLAQRECRSIRLWYNENVGDQTVVQ